jgi:very-short-patch-repair endonuclease
MSDPRELLVGLLDYIKEQAKVVDPRGFVLGATSSFLRRRRDVAGLTGVEFDLRIEADHVWMRVPRLVAEPPPNPPESHKQFLRVNPNPEGQPPSLDEAALTHALNKAIEERVATGSEDERSIARFEEKWWNTANRVLESYTASWKSWAAIERLRRKTIALYGDLFALMHQMEAEQTSKPQELVWGIGVSSWRLHYEKGIIPFEYPFLTQSIEISLDDDSMALELRPRATDTRVEFDAIAASRVDGAIEVEQAAIEQLNKHQDRPVTPFDPGSYADVLKLLAGNLDSEGTYTEVLVNDAPVPAPGEHLVVTDSWVLLARPRTANYLFDDLKRLQAKLNDGCVIPEGPLSLVSPPSDEPIAFEAVSFRGISSRGHSDGRQAAEELYFPLPYNDEQVTIVKNLKHGAGVAVQGPPGTGKTHTIANIICHYLASGKRVLVTSRGDAALSVLQEKIPDEVRALTVALLASDRDGVRQFQASIETIQHRVSQLNPELTRNEIERSKSAIDRAHAELAGIDRRVDEIALQQLSDIEVDGVPMRAQKLAELVVTGQELHGWFDDTICLSTENAPPFSDNDAGRLRETLRALGSDLVYAQASVPSADVLPTVTELTTLHGLLVQKERIEADVENVELITLKTFTPRTLEYARKMLVLTEEAFSDLSDIEEYGENWPLELRIKCRQSIFASERSALESLLHGLDDLIQSRAEFLKRPVSFPEVGLQHSRTLEAVNQAASTGKPFGFIAIGAGDARKHISSVLIAGRAPSCIEEWMHVQKYVSLHRSVQDFCLRWNEVKDLLSVPTLEGGVAGLRQIEIVATVARKAHRLATHYDDLLVKQAREVFKEVPLEALTGSREDLESIRKHLVQILTLDELSQAPVQLNALNEKVAGGAGPVVDELHLFMETTLGNQLVSSAAISSRYSEILAELRRIASLGTYLSFVNEYAEKIKSAGAPKLAFRVRTMPVSPSGENTTLPTTWRDAWNWARIRTHLDRIEGRSELLSLATRRRELESGLARFYREMVANSAWLATKKNATPMTLQALAGYAIAIRKIGQGTGPNATRYRRNARQAMYDAAGAVPCWIMNHHRISEAMPADIGMFDLVIVDEASQSDIWALPAILRGKKILVVGDDKQVSPTGGFIEGVRIQEMLDRFLRNQPYATEMTPDKSLYDLSARVFAANQIMLREHFRCVPPIIAYSNQTFYKGQIQPLRIPSASERIEPPLVDIYVEGGTRDRHDRNNYEAQAIADEINAILKDEKLRGRTIGVVSLLGTEQAKHIDSVVAQRCDMAELRRRKFLCGEARTFQGSERHIMFLSLVVDSENCHALSGNMYDQSFNVAASRAQDRMYLVRSVQLSHLSERDLRTGLLTHFDNPLIVDKAEAEILIDRCESGFEKQVYSELVSRGYRVTPQVKTGAYRIDMVVEGSGDLRLAIECDGDEFHGPDRWQHDMNRQRVLERAGWNFWRCFASTWTLRKDEVLEELTQRLYSMGIEPMGAIDRATRLVEKRVWKYESDVAESQYPQSDDTHDADASDREDRPAQLNLVTPVPVVVSTEDFQHKEGRAAMRPLIETRTRPDTGTTGDAPAGSASDLSSTANKGKAAESESQVRTTQPVRSAPRISLHGGENGNGKVETISKVSAEDWFSLAKWAKENNHLEPWQRKFAFTLGMHITRGKGVSEKQSPYAVKILEEAMSLGFNISE